MTKIIEVKTTDLVPDNTNANQHTERGIAMVEASLRKRGFRFAGTLDKNNRIVHGNNRHERATDIGIEDVIVIEADPTKQYYLKFVDLDLTDPDNPARELAYQANRSAQVSIDFEPEQILADLNSGLDLGQFWNEGELNTLLAGLDTEQKEDAGPQIDKAAELQDKWGTQTGQIWQLGQHRLVVGDCTDKAVVEAVMRGERFDGLITDPPYGVNYEGGRNISNIPRQKIDGDNAPALYNQFLSTWKSHRANKGVLYIWFASSVGKPVYDAIMDNGFIVRALIIWNKIDPHYGNFMAQYLQKHEPCLYCVKDGTNWYGPTNETTVWDIKQPSKNEFHPTEKPLECMSRPIQNSSKEGDIIADPFLGSGTTLIACEQLKRKCRAIEISPAYVGVTLERFFQFTGVEPVLLSE